MEGLAALVGVKWQAVQLWEKPGGTAPKRTRLKQVADALGTTQTYLIMGNISPAAPPIIMSDKSEYIHSKRSSAHIDKLIELASAIDDTGLRALIDVAECFTKSHPAQKAKAS
jgi:hypothetical protein